jgi:L-lactate dehydrogenase complex protein LldF
LQLGDPEFQELLNCIRCGACLNACPVYRHIGGHAYGGTYSGPIGAVLTPALNKNVGEWDDIANASSLCGACYEACPVKIPLHEMLIYLRRRKLEQGHGNVAESLGMKGFAAVMGSAKRYSTLVKLGKLGQKLVVRDGGIRLKLGPLKGWNTYRVTPSLPKKSFRDQWGTLEQELRHGLQELDPAVKSRMEAIMRDRDSGGGNGHG